MSNKHKITSAVILIFHAVGFWGFVTPGWDEIFIKLVPFHLLLMFAMLLFSGYQKSRQIILFSLGTALAGFLIEVIGVNTGKIFGNYYYGETLGIKLWNTPLMIGINWLLLVYSVGILLQKISLKSKLLFAICGGLVLTCLDFLIEPVAIQFDYWSWKGDTIPIQNYTSWFLFSCMLFLGFVFSKFQKVNPTAIVFVIIQFAFFIALNIWAL